MRDLLSEIQTAVRSGAFRMTVHGLREATADGFAIRDVRDAIISPRAEILENYPEDPRGASCLMLCWTADERPIHMVVSHPPVVAVVTVYVPGEDRWQDLRTRRNR